MKLSHHSFIKTNLHCHWKKFKCSNPSNLSANTKKISQNLTAAYRSRFLLFLPAFLGFLELTYLVLLFVVNCLMKFRWNYLNSISELSEVTIFLVYIEMKVKTPPSLKERFYYRWHCPLKKNFNKLFQLWKERSVKLWYSFISNYNGYPAELRNFLFFFTFFHCRGLDIENFHQFLEETTMS